MYVVGNCDEGHKAKYIARVTYFTCPFLVSLPLEKSSPVEAAEKKKEVKTMLSKITTAMQSSGKASCRILMRNKNNLNIYKPNFVRGFSSLGTYKSTTGLVGLEVDPDGKQTLEQLANDILLNVQKIPSTSQYRINTEKWFKYIKKVLAGSDDYRVIEEEIGVGQIEEVIEMAKNELELVEYYYESKGWERVAEAQERADSLVDDMADTIYFSVPEYKAPPPEPPK